MTVNIYLASSVKGMRRQDGVVAYILEAEGKEDKTLTQFGSVEQVTENESYLRALKYALRRINTKCGMVIWTDNRHIYSAFSQGWLEKWQKNGWMTAKCKEVASRTEWEEIAKLLGGTVPEVKTGEQHTFKAYMDSEVVRRAKKKRETPGMPRTIRNGGN